MKAINITHRDKFFKLTKKSTRLVVILGKKTIKEERGKKKITCKALQCRVHGRCGCISRELHVRGSSTSCPRNWDLSPPGGWAALYEIFSSSSGYSSSSLCRNSLRTQNPYTSQINYKNSSFCREKSWTPVTV